MSTNLEVVDQEYTQNKSTGKAGEVETITLADGRTIDFVGRTKIKKDFILGEDGSFTLELIFRNGEVRNIHIPVDNFLNFAKHGASQKFGDTFNAEEDIDDGINAIDEMALRLASGQWTQEREKGAGKGGSMLVQALVECLGVDRSKVQEFLLSKSVAEKRALMGTDQIKVIIDRIKAEKASKSIKSKPTIDTNSLLDQLKAL